jgi:hypothetical protein
VTTDCKIERVKDLRQLRLLFTQDEDGLKEYVYPQLRVGDVWWIPDSMSDFGESQRHPWVIVRGYSLGRANVMACPRTTKIAGTRRGLVTPPGILPGLDQRGLILLRFRRSFVAKHFRDFEYIGQLPNTWIQKIRAFYKASATGRTKK